MFAVAAGFAAALLLAPPDAKALSFTLDTVLNGTGPTSASPWLLATFANNGANTVTLTLTSSLEVASEFISAVAFNVAPGIVPSSLSIVQNPVAAPIPTSILHTTGNAQNLTGGGSAGFGFDVQIAWGTAGPPSNAARFNNTDVVSFTLTRTGLTENDFNFTNTGSAAAHLAAHVQGIPVAGGGTISGAIQDDPPTIVPEPGTWLLMATGLLGLLGYGWRKRLTA